MVFVFPFPKTLPYILENLCEYVVLACFHYDTTAVTFWHYVSITVDWSNRAYKRLEDFAADSLKYTVTEVEVQNEVRVE